MIFDLDARAHSGPNRDCAGSARRPICTRPTGRSPRRRPIVDVVVDLIGAEREVPPFEAQLQSAARRRGGEVAPGHPVLAPHQLRPPHDRRVPRRRGRRGWVRSASYREVTTARSTTSTTPTSGWAHSPTPTSRTPGWRHAVVPERARGDDHRAQLPDRARFGTESIRPTPARCSCRRTRRPMHVTRTPISFAVHRTARSSRRGGAARGIVGAARKDPARPCPTMPPAGPVTARSSRRSSESSSAAMSDACCAPGSDRAAFTDHTHRRRSAALDADRSSRRRVRNG